MRERYYYTVGGKQRLCIEIKNYENFDPPLLYWVTTFDPEEFPPIEALLSEAIKDGVKPRQREIIINQVFEMAFKIIPKVERFFIPEFYLDPRGKVSENLQAFYRQKDKEINDNPPAYLKYLYAYTESTDTMIYRLSSTNLVQRHHKFIQDHASMPLEKWQFEAELCNDQLRSQYFEHYYADNELFVLRWEYYKIGRVNCYYIVNNGKVPFLFMKKSILRFRQK